MGKRATENPCRRQKDILCVGRERGSRCARWWSGVDVELGVIIIWWGAFGEESLGRLMLTNTLLKMSEYMSRIVTKGLLLHAQLWDCS